jgi:hypothetical protein
VFLCENGQKRHPARPDVWIFGKIDKKALTSHISEIIINRAWRKMAL